MNKQQTQTSKKIRGILVYEWQNYAMEITTGSAYVSRK